jgi:uncharacterized damage-inducible protein DinB
MTATQMFLDLWAKEGAATRAVISRIPEGSGYRPDPKSRTAREVAWVLVLEANQLVDALERGSIDWQDVPPPATVADVLAEFDKQRDAHLARLRAIPESRWAGHVEMLYQGAVVSKSTTTEMAFGFLLDMIHHRGQLTTYLRPMGSTVPQVYGPTADEP